MLTVLRQIDDLLLERLADIDEHGHVTSVEPVLQLDRRDLGNFGRLMHVGIYTRATREGPESSRDSVTPVHSGMEYQITVRYGGARQRYHTFVVSGSDATEALRQAADEMPAEIAHDVDLVELRIAVDPDRRSYLGESQPA